MTVRITGKYLVVGILHELVVLLLLMLHLREKERERESTTGVAQREREHNRCCTECAIDGITHREV